MNKSYIFPIIFTAFFMSSVCAQEDNPVLESFTEKDGDSVSLGVPLEGDVSYPPDGEWENSLTGIQKAAQILLIRNDELRAQYAMLDKQMDQLDNAIALQQKENTRMRNDLDRRERMVVKEDWAGNFKNKIKLKQKELIEHKEKLNDLLVKFDNEQKALQLHQLQLDDLKLQKQSLSIEVKAQEEYYQAYNIDDRPELKVMLDQIKSADEQINALEKQLADLEKQSLPGKEELAALRKENEALVVQIEDKKRSIKEKKRMNALELSQKEKEKYQIEVAKKEKLAADIAELQEVIKKSELKHKAVLRKKVKNPEIDVVREMSRIDAGNQVFEERISSLQENVALLKENLSILRQQHQALEAKRLKAK